MKSQNGARPALVMAERLSASLVLVLGFVSQNVHPSAHMLARAVSNSGGMSQSSGRTPNTGTGVIAGVVVNERQEPVARAQVQAFGVRTRPVRRRSHARLCRSLLAPADRRPRTREGGFTSPGWSRASTWLPRSPCLRSRQVNRGRRRCTRRRFTRRVSITRRPHPSSRRRPAPPSKSSSCGFRRACVRIRRECLWTSCQRDGCQIVPTDLAVSDSSPASAL